MRIGNGFGSGETENNPTEEQIEERKRERRQKEEKEMEEWRKQQKEESLQKFKASSPEIDKAAMKDRIRLILQEEGPLPSVAIMDHRECGVDEEDFREILKEMVEDKELEIRYLCGKYRQYFFRIKD